MSLLFLEGFGGYATGAHSYAAGADPTLNWTSWTDSFTLTSLHSGSQGNIKYLTSTGQPRLITPTFSSATSTVIVGARIYNSSGGAAYAKLRTGTSLCGSIMLISNKLWYTRNIDGSLYSSAESFSADRSVPSNTWQYFEVKVVLSNSVGTVDFWVNGVAAGSHTGKDTAYSSNTTCDNVQFCIDTTYYDWSSTARITDIYVDNSTRHGPMDIWYQAADTAGSAANFTPSAGSNYQNVDDIGSDGDTTYNSSTATTTKDQIAHGDTLSVAPVALQPMVMARYVPTGSANIKVGVLSGATEDLDSAVGLGSSYDGVRGKIYEVDPNTSSAWTASNADSAETVYEHN